MSEAPSERRLFKTKEAAVYLGLSERTLWTLANAGKIPRVLFGMGRRKSVRFDRTDLDAWIGAQKEGGR